MPLPIVPAVYRDGALRIAVNADSPLADVWGAALAQVTLLGIQRNVLLMRTSETAFTALDGVCTHEGCTVSRLARPVFVCPCHGSRYDHTGAVVQGPAPAALPRYAAAFADSVVSVIL